MSSHFRLMNETALLNKKIQELGLSPEFKYMASKNKLETIRDITGKPIKELMKLPDMDNRLLFEISSLLKGYGKLDLLKEV